MVTTSNAGGESGNSNQAGATPQAPPDAPIGLTAAAGNTQVTLTWDASATASSYTVASATTPGGPYTPIAGAIGITATTYTDTGLTNGTTYYYVVAASNVKRSLTSDSGYQLIASNVTDTRFIDTGVTMGTAYYYVVIAVNTNGASGLSNQASATPLPALQITNINADQILSGDVTVTAAANDFTSPYSNVMLKVDNVVVDTSSPQGGASEPSRLNMFFSTEEFSNGQHTLSVNYDGGQSVTLRVIFQNNISDLHYNSIFDSTPGANDVPAACHVTATTVGGLNRTVAIEDAAGNPLKTFPSSTGPIDLTWDGLNDTGVAQPDGNYQLVITSGSSNSIAKAVTSTKTNRVRKNSASTQITIPAIKGNGLNWKVEIQDVDGTILRTFTGIVKTAQKAEPEINVLWDGKDEDGEVMPDGYYNAIVTTKTPSIVSKRPSRVTVRDVVGPTTRVINKDSITDSFLLMDEHCFNWEPDQDGSPGALASSRTRALAYAQYVVHAVAQKAPPVGQTFAYTPHALVVSAEQIANDPSLVTRINNHFSAQALLVYVAAHGGWGPNLAPYFAIGNYNWHSASDALTASSPSNNFNVRTLVYPLNYGDTGDPDSGPADPPRLVWMDNCNSAGGYSRQWPDMQYPHSWAVDTSWPDCFGITDYTGYEGVFLGWSGFGYIYHGPPNQSTIPWDTWREAMWRTLFSAAGGTENFQTAIYQVNIVHRDKPNFVVPVVGRPLQGAGSTATTVANPPDRARWWGIGTTAF